MKCLYTILDYFFLFFHFGLILFNVFAWIMPFTRKWNFITLMLTAASWFLLGIFYGWGFCFLTEWHWQILHKLGYDKLPDSYVKYLLLRLFHWDVNASLVNRATLICFLLAVLFSAYFNFFWKKRQGSSKGG